MIQAPGTWTGGHEPQEHEAEDHRLFTAVSNWPKATRRPSGEIGDRHLAAENERTCARQQSQGNQKAADDFQWACEAVHCGEIAIDSPAGETPDFLGSVLEEKKTDGNAQHAKQIGRPPGSVVWRAHV